MNSSTAIRSYFPIFTHQPDLVYLDNAATTQRPHTVLKSVSDFYERENASVHRGLYPLAAKATQRYEAIRSQVARFIGAESAGSIAFTKGTTESINLVANSFARTLKSGDNVIVSAMEHHANLIPWQAICRDVGASLRALPVDDRGDLEIGKLEGLLDQHTRMLAICHISNVLGTVNQVEPILAIAHRAGVPVMVDAAQSVGRWPVNVSSWGADFLAFSAHKMYGPMGVGVLYAKPEWHSHMRPLNYGGGAVRNVEWNKTDLLDFPHGVEPGTADVAGVLGLGAAMEFIDGVGLEVGQHHVQNLGKLCKERLKQNSAVIVIGGPKEDAGIISFIVKNIHAHDVASFLGSLGVAVRAGHHCAQPLLQRMGVPATVRVSFSIYNNEQDINRLMDGLESLQKFWK